MSSVLIIRPDAAWVQRPWVYDRMLQHLANQLEQTDPALSDFLLRCQSWDSLQEQFGEELEDSGADPTHFSVGICDLSSVVAARFQNLYGAVKEECARS